MPYADVAAARLYYEDCGAGEALLLIHGIGASAEDWEGQIPEFAARYRVVAPDLRGYGRSQRKGPFSIQRFAQDCWALLDRLGIQRCCIVGHSLGGAVALQMAVDQPQRVERLVVTDSLPSFRPDSARKWGLFFYRLIMMFLFGPKRLSAAVSARLFPAPEQAALRQRVAMRNGRNSRWVYLRTIPRVVRWSVTDRLAELRMPTLILAAEFDYFPVEEAVRFAGAIPAARLDIMQGLHHSAPIEAPARFNPLVLDFLAARRL